MRSAQVSAASPEAAMMSNRGSAERLRTRSRRPWAKTVPMLVGILAEALRSVREGDIVSTPAIDVGVSFSCTYQKEGRGSKGCGGA